jgi:cytochrome c biogenesis protein CcmG, thiol:disulfide interchange protein DsbE
MKTTLLLITTIVIFGQLISQPSEYSSFKLKTLNGEEISSVELLNTNQTTLFIFWKSGSTICCDNLDNMQTAWLNQLRDKNVRMVAICVECNGNWNNVKPMVYGNDWEFEVYLDVNGDCRRAMQVTNVPYTILLDENQKLICSYAGYCQGNEELICSKILHLMKTDNPELLSNKIK